MSRNTLLRLSSNQCGSDNSFGSSRGIGEREMDEVDDDDDAGVVPASTVIKPDHPYECTSTEELVTALPALMVAPNI
jgi:hypothetical protein